MKFDHGLGLILHVRELTSAMASIAGLAGHHKVHLPPNLVADVIRVLLVGKIGYGAAAMLHPCPDQDVPHSSLIAALQVRWLEQI